MNNQTNYQPSAFDKFSFVVRKIFSGVPFLVLSIIISCLSLFQLITLFSTMGSLFDRYIGSAMIIPFLSSLINCVFYALLTAGCWCLYAGAVNRNDPSNNYIAKIGLVKAYPVFQLIMSWIATVLVAICGFFIIIVAIAEEDAIREALAYLSYYLYYSGLSMFAEMMYEGGVAIIFILLLIFITVMVFTILRYSILANTLKNVKEAMYTGTVPQFNPMFFAVVSFIFGGFGIIGALTTLSVSALNGFVSLLSAAAVIMAGVIMLIAKNMLNSQGVSGESNGGYRYAAPQYAAPQYAAPQQPQYAAPQYAAPQQPQYAAPQYAAPQQPQYAAPQYAAPQQPQYAAPQYAAPQQPQYAAPQQPQYSAPQAPADNGAAQQ